MRKFLTPWVLYKGNHSLDHVGGERMPFTEYRRNSIGGGSVFAQVYDRRSTNEDFDGWAFAFFDLGNHAISSLMHNTTFATPGLAMEAADKEMTELGYILLSSDKQVDAVRLLE